REDGYILVVLGGGANQSRTANVDVFDEVFVRSAGLRQRGFKRIEVAHDQIDGHDAMRLQRGPVLGMIADGQDAAMDQRVQRLDAAIQDLGEARDLGNVTDRESGLLQGSSRSTGGDQLDMEFCQDTSEIDQAGLVADTEQGPTDSAECHTATSSNDAMTW